MVERKGGEVIFMNTCNISVITIYASLPPPLHEFLCMMTFLQVSIEILAEYWLLKFHHCGSVHHHKCHSAILNAMAIQCRRPRIYDNDMKLL